MINRRVNATRKIGYSFLSLPRRYSRTLCRLGRGLLADIPLGASQPGRLAKYGYEGNLDANSACVRRAAQMQGIPTSFVELQTKPNATTVLQIDIGQQTYFYYKGVLSRRCSDGQSTQHINADALPITRSKAAIKALLADADVLVPVGRPFVPDQLDDALAYGLALGGPVCVKPDSGHQGRQVSPDLKKRDEIAAALKAVFARNTTALVEQSVSGEVIRFFYVEPDIVGARLSRSASVTGDGRSSIGALIEAINEERRIRRLPGHDPVVVDQRMQEFLTSIGFSLDAVPALDQQVPLSPVSNFARGGGQGVNLTDEIHPSHREAAARGFAAIPGLRLAANDMMVPRPSEPHGPGNGWTLEINSSPSIESFHTPWEGEPQDIAGAIVRFMMRDAEERMSAASVSAPTTVDSILGGRHADPDAGLLQTAATRAGLPTAIVMAARREGRPPRPYLRIAVGDVHFNYRRGALFDASPGDQDTAGRNVNGAATRIAASIAKTRLLLDRAGLPIPPTGLFPAHQKESAAAFARRLSGKIRIRPDAANAGGLIVDSDTPGEIDKAVGMVAARGGDLIVELVVSGAELRFLYAAPRMMALAARLPQFLQADGQSSVLQLLRRHNDDADAQILLTPDLVATLARQSLDLETVPAVGARVALGTTVHTRLLVEPGIGSSLVHESYTKVADAAVSAIEGLVLSTVIIGAAAPSEPALPGNHWLVGIDNGLSLLPFTGEGASQRRDGDTVADGLVRWMMTRASVRG